MAATIYLQADLKGNAEVKLQNIDALAKSLASKPIEIKVNASGVEGLSKKLLDVANNQARAQIAAANLSKEQEKTRQAAEKTAQAIEKTKQAQEKTAQAMEKTAQTQNRLASETQKTQRSFHQMNATAQQTQGILDSIAAKFTLANLATMAIYKVTTAFGDALDTMKEVDTQLVDIQKVTDYSDKQMQQLSATAYDLASNMGRTADEVLASSVEFARAGYKDQIEDLSELSILLQNIGDVDNTTANQFILAADAAWDLGGSTENLMPILDGLNEITNKNATDMGKLAEGVTVAASVFANAGESVDTFAAMLGTTTAATQRSGTEMARGLRTILMNIRQIKGETEDGELIDGESIANASKALKEYANISTMTNGELRKSSDVLAELAGKWGSLDSVAQSAIGEALAGKRQANVLNALMSNWDMYEKMLEDYTNGAGSALQENEIYLDSWEAKSKRLSSTWVEFVSHMVDTGAIKSGLDGIILLVEVLDTDIGRAVITVAALSAGVVVLQKGFSKLNTVMKANPLFWKAAAVIAGVMAVVTAFDALTTTYDEHIEKIEELNSQYEETQSEIDELTAKIEENNAVIAGTKPLADGESVEFLQQQNEALENQIALLKEKQALVEEERNQEIRDTFESRTFNASTEGLIFDKNQAQKEFDELDRQWKEHLDKSRYGGSTLTQQEADDLYYRRAQASNNLTSAEQALDNERGQVLDYREKIEELSQEIDKLNAKPLLSDEEERRLQDAKTELTDIGIELSDIRQDYTGNDSLTAEMDELIEKTVQYTETAQQGAQEVSDTVNAAAMSISDYADAVSALNTEIDNLQSAYTTLTNAVNEYNESGYISIDTFQQLLELGPEYYSLLVNESGQLSLNTEAYQKLTAAKIENMAISQSLEVVQQALDYAAQGQAEALNNLLNITNDNTNATWGLVNAKLSAIAAYEREGTVAEGTTASLEKYVKTMRQASQAAIAGIGAGYTGKSSGSSASSAKNTASSLLSELNQAVNKELEKAKEAMQAQVDAIDAQIDALKAARDLEKTQLDIEEKKLAVMKAQEELTRVSNERTVRMLVGDEWQWVADQGAVESAEEALKTAQDDLREAQIELAYQQQLAELERQKEAIQAQYKAYEEQWKALQESMQEPTRDINEILADIAKNGTPEMKAQVENVAALLAQLGVAINSAIASIGSRRSSSSGSSNSSSNYNPSTGGGGMTNTPAYDTGKGSVSSGVGHGIAGSMNSAHSAGSSTSSGVGLGLGKFFDSGGVADGRGMMPKGPVGKELVLGPDMTAKILSPMKNGQFEGFVDSLEHMFTMSSKFAPKQGETPSDSHDINYYINGVKIGESEKNKPLAQVLSTLSLHVNY